MSKIVKVQSHDIRQLGINPNHWYVVALSPEVKTQPVGVMLWKQAMGEAPPGTAIALYCDSKGPIHALEDRCPHRLVKLIKLGLFRNYFSLVCAVFILNLWMPVK